MTGERCALYLCRFCSLSFPLVLFFNSLSLHLALHHHPPSPSSGTAPEVGGDRNSLREQQPSKQSGRPCKYANEMANDHRHLAPLIKTHLMQNTYPCPNTRTKFPRQAELWSCCYLSFLLLPPSPPRPSVSPCPRLVEGLMGKALSSLT